MRIAFLSRKEDELVRSLKKQHVFTKAGSVIPFKKELVVDLGYMVDHSSPTIVDLYRRSVSRRKGKAGGGEVMRNLVGLFTTHFELDEKKIGRSTLTPLAATPQKANSYQQLPNP